MINGGEGLTVEFKQSRTKLNRDVSEFVCALHNLNGGHLFLGVDDQASIVGIDPDSIEKVKMGFITAMYNPLKICPTFYLSIEVVEIKNRTIFCFLRAPRYTDAMDGFLTETRKGIWISLTTRT